MADEIVSRTVEAALQSQFDTTRGSSASAWLFGIARKMVLKERGARPRRPVQRGPVNWEQCLPAATLRPDEQLEANDERERVRTALAELGSHDRRLIEMHYGDGLSAPEIAAQLNVAPGTVRVWLHRARKAVEKVLSPLRGGAEP
jgi:RNA polymerase sigma-70 factor (ECF subfamily)